MSEKNVIKISIEEAQNIDPSQIVSIQMRDGTNIKVKGIEMEDGFVEEIQQDEQQYQTQEVQEQQSQNLRGRGLGALAGLAAGTALLGTAAAIGMRRPYMGLGMRPMFRPVLFGPPMYDPFYYGYPPYGPWGRPMFF